MLSQILTYQPFAFMLLLVLTFVRRCRMGRCAQVAWLLALGLCAARYWLSRRFFESLYNPELSEALIWVWNWAYCGMCLLLLLSLVLFFLPPRVKLYVLPLLAWTTAAVGMWNGVKLPELREVEISFANLPESLDGYRILQITDVHASSSARRWRTEGIVAKANAAGADLIVVTGDLVDGLPEKRADDMEPIRRLSARDGVLFCTGNHEYYGDWAAWSAKYDEWGLRFLDGEWVSPRPGLAVGGVRDAACVRKCLMPAPDASGVFDGATNGEFRVFLQHRPYLDYAKYASRPLEDFDLQISGHTHGGIMPVVSQIVGRFNAGFVSGVYDLGRGRRLFVSRGAGQWAGFPARFFDDSEITVIVLRRRRAAANLADGLP